MVIISSYFSNETYGLLGPQMAATIIQENTPFKRYGSIIGWWEEAGLHHHKPQGCINNMAKNR
jgi:hypothetical protein